LANSETAQAAIVAVIGRRGLRMRVAVEPRVQIRIRADDRQHEHDASREKPRWRA